ncbi:MAG TPA: SDR family oxidoreductase [Polyangia bacterium]
MNMERRGTALVTGASSGIGLDLAKRFAAEGYDVALVARSEGKLKEVAAAIEAEHHVRAHVVTADLAAPRAADALVAALEARGIDVDVLVNNAGYALYGAFTETDLADELAMIQVNIVALTHLTKLVVRKMVARGGGRVLNVASTAAFQPGPLMAVYYATKAYVLSFSEALANELDGTGVSVTALCPGPTKTGFQARAQMEQSKLVRGKEIMTAETVARIGYAGLMKGKTVVIPGVSNKMMAQAVRFLPRKTVTRLVRNAQERAPH